jgi:hypothetical protein
MLLALLPACASIAPPPPRLAVSPNPNINITIAIAQQQLAPPSPPSSVRVGAMLVLGSEIGRFARDAIELALQDVNAAADVLPRTQLLLDLLDTGCDPVQGAACGIPLCCFRPVCLAVCFASEMPSNP